MQTLDEAIEQSRRILDFSDDWDGDGSPAYSRDTWERAIAFLQSVEQRVREKGHVLAVPKIMPGTNGDIDIMWGRNGMLLLTIPADESNPVEYYGRSALTDTSIKGAVASDQAEGMALIPWMSEHSDIDHSP